MSLEVESTSSWAQGLLAVADELEAWSAALPHWEPNGSEPWSTYLHRRLSKERVMGAKLRRLPGCLLIMSGDSRHVDLTLAGVRTRSDQALPEACRRWIIKAKGLADPVTERRSYVISEPVTY